MRIVACRVCGNKDLKTIIELGDQYLSDFRSDNTKPNKYPLDVVFCDGCKLVQLRDTAPSGEMYHENYGFKSGVSESIKADLLDNVKHVLTYIKEPTNWLDIASNDGTLLGYVPESILTVGIDPIGFLCDEAEAKGHQIINDFFDPKYFDTKFDAITSISMFYDLDDPNTFVAGVKSVLADKGVWDIQQNYLLTTLKLNAVDNICHEHLEYYTLRSLENLLDRHGLAVIDVSTSTVNGGSLRTIVAHKGAYETQPSVQAQRDRESAYGIDNLETYLTFGEGIMYNLASLMIALKSLKDAGKSLYIMAASTRGSTIWQAAGIGPNLVTAAVEKNPAKVGKNFSAIGVPIISEETFRANCASDSVGIIGPWFFAEEIVKRERQFIEDGGVMIVPLPEIEVVAKENLDKWLS